jgi:hypothetical protein
MLTVKLRIGGGWWGTYYSFVPSGDGSKWAGFVGV